MESGLKYVNYYTFWGFELQHWVCIEKLEISSIFHRNFMVSEAENNEITMKTCILITSKTTHYMNRARSVRYPFPIERARSGIDSGHVIDNGPDIGRESIAIDRGKVREYAVYLGACWQGLKGKFSISIGAIQAPGILAHSFSEAPRGTK